MPEDEKYIGHIRRPQDRVLQSVEESRYLIEHSQRLIEKSRKLLERIRSDKSLKSPAEPD
ncbi:hypothetical protein EOA75_13735 [Mesorhizobium sp. M1A.F.Ca.IN.022.07.1.1]|uniref:hypothetical protein n=1 Tax=unclassified Mesorhizobium TaxID=325217 RepID=UPI000FCC0713|nr:MULTISPECIES: hypothetical protein [unclassified Mesorhizobium]RUV93628.1 hypothetical protein EOA75_13735 [Mesorhizobium sp. M1A.F.Ca.IN.022.07.1.1]RWI91278.1 MAG: hypothetical protein EOR21_20610 [Mesorhizobium sp.]TIS66914.1 MAG: hypothetical protein E5X11_08470 [Mesorhizobium sp.]